MRLRPLLIVALMSLVCASAQADIYGYIDEKGEGHFSTEKLDEHYQLFQRSGEVFDSSKISGPMGEANSAQLTRYLLQHPNLKKYESLVDQAAREYAVEPALLKAVMAAESGFNPNAISPKGAIGLMQLMPATAQHYGLQADRQKNVQQKLTDPKTNIGLAAHYLSDLGRMFEGRLDLVVASYNAGEHAVQRYNNTIPPYPETRDYVEIVTRIYKMYKPSSGNPSLSTTAGAAVAPTRVHMIIPAHPHEPEHALDSAQDQASENTPEPLSDFSSETQ
jgi:soluble lytic murein transglycosylase-like protein